MATCTAPYSNIKEIVRCRSCGSDNLIGVLNLGMQYVVDFPLMINKNALRAPLHLVRCIACSLVQLKHSVAPDLLFRTFWYKSGLSETMRTALQDIVTKASKLVNLTASDQVLDIGSNDGTLLSMYPYPVHTVGFEPCKQLAIESVVQKRTVVAVTDFFSKDSVPAWYHSFKIITAIAMFYDVENPTMFLEYCRDYLAKNGVLVIQMNYLKSMLKNTTVDNISHEHLTYWSLTALNHLVKTVGLEIKSIEENTVNGGSFRVYITHRGDRLTGFSPNEESEMREKVLHALEMEYKLGLDGEGIYYEFFKRKLTHKIDKIRKYVINSSRLGDKWYIYGASTRGTALLQVMDLPDGIFEGAAERDEAKYGHKMVSGWIPIYSEEHCRTRANRFLVLPYHFKEQIVDRERDWLNNGGELLFPFPEPQVISKYGVNYLQ